jgi:uncharacterized protein YndB with AHSA1/START domain
VNASTDASNDASTDAAPHGVCVEREIEIAASPETLWELLTDQDQAVTWMGLTASFDLRPGGAYRVEVIPDRTVIGEFVEIDPPHRLVYTWGWESRERGERDTGDLVPPGSTTVEFELVPSHAGTLLRLRHSDLPTAQSASSHTRGWHHYLERLDAVAMGRDPGPDPWITQPMQ